MSGLAVSAKDGLEVKKKKPISVRTRLAPSSVKGVLPKCFTHHKRLHIRILTPQFSLEIEGSGSGKTFGKHNSVVWETAPQVLTPETAPRFGQLANLAV
jgi:hypothetical protein